MLLNTVYNIGTIPAFGDPHWKNTIGLWPMDGSTNNIAENRWARLVNSTAFGGTVLSSSSPAPKFGTASIHSDVSQSDGGVHQDTPSDSMFFGNRDFTVEFWAYRAQNWASFFRPAIGTFSSGTNGSWCIFCVDSLTTNPYSMQLFVQGMTNPVVTSGATSLPLTTWTHVCLERTGTSMKMYFDGSLVGSSTISADQVIGANRLLVNEGREFIGRNNVGSQDWWRGNIDDVRITRSMNRYGSAFTPLAEAHPTSGTFGGWSSPPASTDLDASVFTNISPVAGWGTILRNPSYSGPALRIANDANSDEMDINFDANGYVTGALPYGDNTRVIKIYDQWGSDDLTCVKAALLRVARDDDWYKTWRIFARDAGSDALKSTKTTTSSPAGAWAAQRLVWMCGAGRWANDSLRTLWGVNNATFMSIGLWVGYDTWHWRVNGSSGSDWTNCHINTDYNKCGGNLLERLIGDMSPTGGGSTGTAYGYLNNTLESTRTYAYPIVYPSAVDLRLMNGTTLNARHFGWVTELHIFSTTSDMNSTERGILDSAMQDAIR